MEDGDKGEEAGETRRAFFFFGVFIMQGSPTTVCFGTDGTKGVIRFFTVDILRQQTLLPSLLWRHMTNREHLANLFFYGRSSFLLDFLFFL